MEPTAADIDACYFLLEHQTIIAETSLDPTKALFFVKAIMGSEPDTAHSTIISTGRKRVMF